MSYTVSSTIKELIMIGDRIKQAREFRELSVNQLADKLLVHQSVICRWESNRTSPVAKTIISLCLALQVSADYILGLSDNL